MKTFFLCFCLLFQFISVFSSSSEIEYLASIKTNDRQDLQNVLEKLESIGIKSYEPQSNGIVEVYVPEEKLQTMEAAGLQFSKEPNPFYVLLKKRALSGYHNYIAVQNLMRTWETTYPQISKSFSVGKSVSGRELYGIRITSRLTETNGRNKPQFKYIGNMHGDEVVGREMLLLLIDELLTQYGHSERITRLIDSTDIYIIPSMNPDGFENARRTNTNWIDLNRNFPDLRFPGTESRPIQPETTSIMEWILAHHFVLSANLHGGAVVANYPFDGSNSSRYFGIEERTPDDVLFKHLALTYSETHTTMSNSREFANGITNGAYWYVLFGGMQDWNYLRVGCMELTLELSDIKYPNGNSLPTFWSQNREAMIHYIEKVHFGIKGFITNENGDPIPATVRVNNLPEVRNDPLEGDYYRLLMQGTYSVTVKSPGYRDQTKTITVESTNPYTAKELNFIMQKV